MIKRIFKRTKESVSNFMSDPVDNLGFLIPVIVVLISLISGIVNYIRFIADGGYSNQIKATKEFGLFGGYEEKFTTGTTGLITADVIGKVILALVCVEVILLMINYFRSSGRAKRIVMIVDLVILGIQITLTAKVFWVIVRKLIHGEEVFYDTLKPFDGMTINPRVILITYVVLTLASLICYLILVLITKRCRQMVGYSVIAIALAFIAIPLVFLFLQNVIALATGVIAIAIIGVVLFIVFCTIFSDDSDSTSTSNDSSSSTNSSEKGKYRKS